MSVAVIYVGVMNWDIYAKCDILVSFPKSYIRLMRLLDCQGIFMYKVYRILGIFGGLVNDVNIAKLNAHVSFHTVLKIAK